MKFPRKVRNGPMNKWLNYGGDPDHGSGSGSHSRHWQDVPWRGMHCPSASSYVIAILVSYCYCCWDSNKILDYWCIGNCMCVFVRLQRLYRSQLEVSQNETHAEVGLYMVFIEHKKLTN